MCTLMIACVYTTVVGAGANINSEIQQIQLKTEITKTHPRAWIWIWGENNIKIESKFKIGESMLFGVKISGTVQNEQYPVDIAPISPLVATLLNLGYSIENGTSFEITCSYLRISAIGDYNGLQLSAVVYNAKITEL